MNRSRRRLIVLAQYAAVLVLAALTLTQALSLQVFLTLAAVPAVMLFAIERMALGGLTARRPSRLDEREKALVARAHWLAHRMAMALTALAAALALVSGWAFGFAVGAAPFAVGGFGLILAFLTLPPALVLWTAPEPVDENHRLSAPTPQPFV